MYICVCVCIKCIIFCLFALNISAYRSTLLPSKELHACLSVCVYSWVELWK